jgi:tetratricopeptide (TPR) repeat protein
MLNKKIKIFGTIIIAGLFCLGMSSCGSSPDSQETFEKGASLIEQGRREEGIAYLRQYVFYHPESYRAHFLLGQSFLSQQNTTQELYLARYYFNKARQLAKTENEQKAADSSYADIQVLMGKGTRSAKVLFKSAERYAKRGQNTVATNFYLRAGSRYMMEEEYSDAEEAFSSGLEIADNEDYVTALVLGNATTFLLDEEPEKSLTALQDLPENRSSTNLCPTLNAGFLRISAEILSIEAKRKLLTMWKKEISEGESHTLEEKFVELNQANNHENAKLSQEQSVLQAQGWVLVAERFMKLEMTEQAKQAFKQAKSLYELAESEEKASEISEELEELES